MRKWLLSAFILSILTGSAAAQQVTLDGYFIALEACAATQKKESGNPGGVQLTPRRAYDMLARNDTPGTHFQIKVPDAPVTQARWVPMSCGVHAVVASGAAEERLPPDSIEAILAASWQPGFCATADGRTKPQCRDQDPEAPAARQFSLHGLWPDDLDNREIFPCYCDLGPPRSCRGSAATVSRIDISAELRARLDRAMPGVQSGLDLHEWSKHGSCYEDDRGGEDRGSDPQEYFEESLALLEQLNGSAVADLLRDKIGQRVSQAELDKAAVLAFGEGAAGRLVLRCDWDRQDIVTEIFVPLGGPISLDSDLGSLIRAAPPWTTFLSGQPCREGRVIALER